MRSKIKLPKLGDTAVQVVVLEWCVEVGADICEGEPLLRVGTDKVDVDVPAPVTGTLVETLVGVDDEVSVGHLIAIIESRR